MEIIDLSQELYSGMPVHKSQPQVKITTHATHEEWEGITDTTEKTPAALRLEMGEHTGTHVDALIDSAGNRFIYDSKRPSDGDLLIEEIGNFRKTLALKIK